MNPEEKYVFCSGDLPIKSYAFFKAKRNHLCDITFNVDDRTISAHRMILSAAIPYFFKVFYEKDVPNSHEKAITFPDIDPNALESLVDFAYSCEIEINENNVKALISAASILEVDQMRDECFRFLANRLNFENALSTRCFLSNLGSSKELDKVDSYIRRNFEEVSKSNDLLNLPFNVLKSMIESDDLKVSREEWVFELIIKWVNHLPEERKCHLPDLLRNVRMSLVKPSYMKNYILKEEFIRTSVECRDIMDEAMCYHCVPEERANVRSFVARHRGLVENTDEISHIFVLYTTMQHRVETLDSGSKEWKKPPHRDIVLDHRQASAELNKKLYFFLPNLTYVYDLERDMFLFCKGMNVPRYWAGAVPRRNKLYVLGGCTQEEELETKAFECFNPNSEEWTSLTDMKISRGAPGVAVHNEFIYVLGGKAQVYGFYSIKNVERYDVKTGTWIVMPPMLHSRFGLGCAVLNGKIYACGGSSAPFEITPTAEVFDPVINEWKFISSMNVNRAWCKLFSFCGKLYCLGGETDEGNSNVVEIYDLEANEWKYGPSMKEKLAITSAVVVNMSSI